MSFAGNFLNLKRLRICATASIDSWGREMFLKHVPAWFKEGNSAAQTPAIGFIGDAEMAQLMASSVSRYQTA